ncbi:Uncharacterized protein Fot_52508 [Forsythia ovata]|uniref:Uncharacterized protein n=1 Tax=Forsythia ovata TaxID=205694 RepID=A0ABD1PKX9_9LAMI
MARQSICQLGLNWQLEMDGIKKFEVEMDATQTLRKNLESGALMEMPIVSQTESLDGVEKVEVRTKAIGTGGENVRKRPLLWRHKFKAVAKRSKIKREISGGPSIKKKAIPIHSGNSGALILRDEKRYEMGTTKEMAVILKRFGDKQNRLFDRFERLSFEEQLNQAILGRSMSEPSVPRWQDAPQLVAKPVRLWKQRGSGFQKLLKKLLKPTLGRKSAKNNVPNTKKPKMPSYLGNQAGCRKPQHNIVTLMANRGSSTTSLVAELARHLGKPFWLPRKLGNQIWLPRFLGNQRIGKPSLVAENLGNQIWVAEIQSR